MDQGLVELLRRPTWLSVNLDTIEANFRDMKKIVGDEVAIAAVLKADAYGHGAVPVAKSLLAAGARMIAVATISEALELRRALREAPLLVMGYTPDALADLVVAGEIVPTVFSLQNARAFSEAALTRGTLAPVQIKLDTGMNRLGIKPYEDPVSVIESISRLKGVFIDGIFTHLALRERESDLRQFSLYEEIIGNCEKTGIKIGLRHVCDSIGTVRYPQFRLDMVRVGAALFGVRPFRMGPEYDAFPFPMAGAFVTHVARIRFLREGEMVSYDSSWQAPKGGTLIATLPVGYADGYPRSFGNKAYVVIRGQRAPVVGLVCMDQAMVDVGSIKDVAEGDEALLLGNSSQGSVTLQEASDWGGTNRNALLCGIGRRVPRVYLKRGIPAAYDDRLSRSTLVEIGKNKENA
jgi:alanine racemase